MFSQLFYFWALIRFLLWELMLELVSLVSSSGYTVIHFNSIQRECRALYLCFPTVPTPLTPKLCVTATSLHQLHKLSNFIWCSPVTYTLYLKPSLFPFYSPNYIAYVQLLCIFCSPLLPTISPPTWTNSLCHKQIICTDVDV